MNARNAAFLQAVESLLEPWSLEPGFVPSPRLPKMEQSGGSEEDDDLHWARGRAKRRRLEARRRR